MFCLLLGVHHGFGLKYFVFLSPLRPSIGFHIYTSSFECSLFELFFNFDIMMEVLISFSSIDDIGKQRKKHNERSSARNRVRHAADAIKSSAGTFKSFYLRKQGSGDARQFKFKLWKSIRSSFGLLSLDLWPLITPFRTIMSGILGNATTLSQYVVGLFYSHYLACGHCRPN